MSVQSTSGATSGMFWGGSNFNQSSEDQLPAIYSGGDWTLSFPSGNFPTDGGYTVRVYATDNDGNVQSPGTAGSFSIDNTPPTVNAPSTTASVKYGSNPTYFDNEPVTLTEVATDAGSGVNSVSYYYCAGSSGSCTSSTPWVLIGSSTTSSGNFAVIWNTPLPADGPYQIVATATDNAGNTSGSSPSTLVAVDTTLRQRCLSQELRVHMMSLSRLLRHTQTEVAGHEPARRGEFVKIGLSAALIAAVLSAVLPVVTATPVAAATVNPTWNVNGGVLTCGSANNATVPVGTTSLTATLTGAGGGGGR